MMIRQCLLAAITLVSLVCASGDDANSDSFLMVRAPESLSKPAGYDHRVARFGIPPNAGSLAQNVYYADSEYCFHQDFEDPKKGYPHRDQWVAPYILMVDRGTCSLTQKVRNAQRAGAAAVVIADNVCYCSDQKCINQTNATQCEDTEVNMADDGSGSDITIPSFLMMKQDAQNVKDELKAQNGVLMELAWNLPQIKTVVKYDLWTSPVDIVSDNFLRSFYPLAHALGSSAHFTPHMHISDGYSYGCEGTCDDMCTNLGRYCSTSNTLSQQIKGSDVVEESLRRLCIWRHNGEQDGIGQPWWDYVKQFRGQCDQDPSDFANEDCRKKAYQHAKIDEDDIEMCISDTGGVDGDHVNELLEQQITDRLANGIVVYPTMVIDGKVMREELTVKNVFQAICSATSQTVTGAGLAPTWCTKCAGCDDPLYCVQHQGVCLEGTSAAPNETPHPNEKRRRQDLLFWFFVLGTLISLVAWRFKEEIPVQAQRLFTHITPSPSEPALVDAHYLLDERET